MPAGIKIRAAPSGGEPGSGPERETTDVVDGKVRDLT
jgi:hypothetical protein